MKSTLAEIDDAIAHARATRRRYADAGNTSGVTVAQSFIDRLLDERLAFAALTAAAA